jgi:aryl-alcohol dehydrogenase-like predicted oxidoreductase
MSVTTMDGVPLSALGLSGNPEMDSACVPAAAAAGINWFFFYDNTSVNLIEGLAPVLQAERNGLFVATGSESRDRRTLERYLDEACLRLGVDVIDLFLAEYVNPKDEMDALLGHGGVLDLLNDWKQQGKIRYAGASAHDRDLAIQLIHSGKIDLLMHRYNMAHRKSEERVMPEAQRADVPILGFTATRWGTLLAGHPEWNGAVPDAADCYRFVLANPAVLATFTAPATVSHLHDNLAALESRTPTPDEREEWERYGALVSRRRNNCTKTLG